MFVQVVALAAPPRNNFGGDREAHANTTGATVLEPPNINAASLAPGSRIAAQINNRFSKRPKLLSEAVLLHHWDGWEPPAAPWSVCPSESPLMWQQSASARVGANFPPYVLWPRAAHQTPSRLPHLRIIYARHCC